eukprot:TRINITY_DN8347_c0_g1_i1.p1 TRINITY_DN8347_c0_g1~~TRINITY_DN8347_c0_g1_i1.p1  ORF type:complete len:201 (-),score=10.83 TRINITY_DN8347_c0_g1_i1:347-949(-)
MMRRVSFVLFALFQFCLCQADQLEPEPASSEQVTGLNSNQTAAVVGGVVLFGCVVLCFVVACLKGLYKEGKRSRDFAVILGVAAAIAPPVAIVIAIVYLIYLLRKLKRKVCIVLAFVIGFATAALACAIYFLLCGTSTFDSIIEVDCASKVCGNGLFFCAEQGNSTLLAADGGGQNALWRRVLRRNNYGGRVCCCGNRRR